MPSFVKRLGAWARALKQDGLVLWFALRHPGTPCGVKLLAFVVVAYALSPIDLVPDFIPILGTLLLVSIGELNCLGESGRSFCGVSSD